MKAEYEGARRRDRVGFSLPPDDSFNLRCPAPGAGWGWRLSLSVRRLCPASGDVAHTREQCHLPSGADGVSRPTTADAGSVCRRFVPRVTAEWTAETTITRRAGRRQSVCAVCAAKTRRETLLVLWRVSVNRVAWLQTASVSNRCR